MSVLLMNAIYNTLKRDMEFMAFFGLSPISPSDDIVKRIVRGMEPDKAITGSDVPMVLVYAQPGRFGRNSLVFEGKFCLDVYAKNSYQARQIAEKAFKLFHDKPIEAEGLRAPRCTLVYDGDFATGITGVKGIKSIYDVDYHRLN